MKKILSATLVSILLLVSFYGPFAVTIPGTKIALTAAKPALASTLPQLDPICNNNVAMGIAAGIPLLAPLAAACAANAAASQITSGAVSDLVQLFTTNIDSFFAALFQMILDKLLGGHNGLVYSPNSPAGPHPLTADDLRYSQTQSIPGVLTANLDNIMHPRGVSTLDYLASIHPITQANALGFDDIAGKPNNSAPNAAIKGIKNQGIPQQPILAVWQFMRNLAYGLFVIVIMVIGFMLMFRARLNPRTVVTATSAIPGLVLSLIFITFGFVLAGFMLDLTNVLLALVRNTFNQWVNFPVDLGVGGLINFAILSAYTFDPTGCTNNPGSVQCILYNTNPITTAPGFLLWLLLQIAFRLTAIIIILMLLFKLIIKWITFLFLVIFSPFYFLLGALPGRSGMYISWIKAASSALLTFPAVLVILYLAIMMDYAAGLTPPDPANALMPGGNIGGLLVLGALFLASRVPEAIEHAFDVIMPAHIAKGGFSAQQMPIIGGLIKRSGG